MTYEILTEHSYNTTEDALYCLGLGLAVFPINGYGVIWEDENSPEDIALGAPAKVQQWCCSCGNLDCESPGKHPLGPAWQRQATRDPDAVRRMDWRNHNVGVITEGITVVDIDPRHGGMREWVDKHGEASTLVVKTNGGGWHYYYKGETRTRIGLAPGIDIKSGIGGYVVGPGSHGEDREYVIESSKASGGFVEVPDWLHTELLRKSVDAKSDLARQTVLGKGERDNGLIAVAGFLRRYGFSERELIEIVGTVNRQRCNPPLDESAVLRIAKSAARYDIESDIPAYQGDILSELKSIEWVIGIEPPKFVIDQLWPEGGVNVMYGRPGTMKSYLALEWALHRSIGKPWHQFGISDPVKVIYVAAEGLFGLGQRVKGIVEGHGLSISDLSGQFSLYPNALNILDESLSERLFMELVDYGAQLVIFDTLRKSMTGGDENNTQDVGKMMTRLERWSTKGNISTLLIHHANKAGTGHRGSSAIEGDAYNMWQILRTGKELVTRVKPEKFKDASDDWKLSIQWEATKTGLVSKSAELPTSDDSEDQEAVNDVMDERRQQKELILELRSEGLTVEQIAAHPAVTKSPSTVGRYIKEAG